MMWGAMTPPPSVMCPPSMIHSNKGALWSDLAWVPTLKPSWVLFSWVLFPMWEKESVEFGESCQVSGSKLKLESVEFGEVVEFFKFQSVEFGEVVEFFKSNEVPKCQPKVKKKAFEISQPRDSICRN